MSYRLRTRRTVPSRKSRNIDKIDLQRTQQHVHRRFNDFNSSEFHLILWWSFGVSTLIYGNTAWMNHDHDHDVDRISMMVNINDPFMYDCYGVLMSNDIHGSYRPFATMMLQVQYELWGKSWFMWHAVNILLNGVVSATAAYTMQRFSGDLNTMLLMSTVLFTVNPMRSQSVALLDGGSGMLMATLVSFMCIRMYFYAIVNHIVWIAVIANMCALCAALFHEQAFATFIIFILLDVCICSVKYRRWRPCVKRVVLTLLFVCVYAYIRYGVANEHSRPTTSYIVSPPSLPHLSIDYGWELLMALTTSLVLIVFPFWPCSDYGYHSPVLMMGEADLHAFCAMCVLVLLVCWLAFAVYKCYENGDYRWWLSLLMFVVPVVCGVEPFTVNSPVVSDFTLYGLPTLGVIWWVSLICEECFVTVTYPHPEDTELHQLNDRPRGRTDEREKVSMAVVVTVIVLMFVLIGVTFFRNRAWVSGAVFDDDFAMYPNNIKLRSLAIRRAIVEDNAIDRATSLATALPEFLQQHTSWCSLSGLQQHAKKYPQFCL